MSRRRGASNAYQTSLPNSIGSGDTSFAITDDTGLPTSPGGYLVLEDESLTLREYISYSDVAGNVLTGVVRGLAGSAAGAVGHSSGAVVRSVMMHQFLDDIFTDIEDIELVDAAQTIAIDAHADDPGDPHAAADAGEGYLTKTAGDALYLLLAGGTMTGDITMGANKVTSTETPSADADYVTKVFADATYEAGSGGPFLPLAGGAMAGAIDMSGNNITDPLDPTVNAHVGDRGYNDARYIRATGQTAMSSDLDMGGNKVTSQADGTAADDGATKGQVDTADALLLPKSGGVGNPMSGNLVMGDNRIAELADAATGTDAVSQDFGDGRYLQQANLNELAIASLARAASLPDAGPGQNLFNWTSAGTASNVALLTASTANNWIRCIVPAGGLRVIMDVIATIAFDAAANTEPELVLFDGGTEVARSISPRIDNNTNGSVVLVWKGLLTVAGNHDFTIEILTNGSAPTVAGVQENYFQATAQVVS